MQCTNLQTTAIKMLLCTEELANLLRMRPQSIRKCYSKTGNYLGIQPIKLPNGRLVWPYDQVAKLLEEAST